MKEFNQSVYKLDSKGKLRVTIVSTDNGILRKESGLIDGKKTVHESKRKPKNVGKANETTSQTQAITEAESLIVKKLREGYSKTKEEAENYESLMPMLALDYFKEESKVVYPAIVQPKLDGIRAVHREFSLYSRKNVPIDTMPHILLELAAILPPILDGELYLHGKSFQDTTKLIKKVSLDSQEVCYYVYDIFMDRPYKERYETLKKLIDTLPSTSKIKLVESYVVNNKEELEEKYQEFIDLGYEGAMVRWGDAGYKKDGRSSSLLKYKKFLDEAMELVDIVPADKNPLHGVPKCKLNTLVNLSDSTIKEWYKDSSGSIVKVIGSDGEEQGYPITRCGAKLSHEEREELLKNKKDYIGKTAEIRFFEKYKSGAPRFPIYHGIRIDK